MNTRFQHDTHKPEPITKFEFASWGADRNCHFAGVRNWTTLYLGWAKNSKLAAMSFERVLELLYVPNKNAVGIELSRLSPVARGLLRQLRPCW
jgi:hypothetical protein